MKAQQRAEALEAQGRHAEAVAAWMEAFAASPEQPELACRLALAMVATGRRGEAVELLGLALSMHPGSVSLHTTRGNLLRALGRFDEALAAQDTALRLAPDSAAVLGNRCALFLAWQRFGEALAAADAALALAPGVVDLRFNRGTCLLHLRRLDEAQRELQGVIALAPSHAAAHLNLGEVLLAQGDPGAAEQAFRQAIRHEPANAEAHWNLALRLLARGAWREGWREYEWRRRLPAFPVRTLEAPEWNGGPLGEALLVTAEQGLGDTFQFLRYLPLARAKAGRVVFECPPALAAVLAGLEGVDAVVPRGAPLPPFSAHAPLLTLPQRCEGGEAHAPMMLAADPARVADMRERLGPGFTVGICWQGNPAYKADAQRSVPLAHFEALAAVDGVKLVCLQQQHGREQLARWPARVPLLDLGALDRASGAFVDTAAALSAVDLLVSSDTAVPHLAGALGREVWLVLPHQADWRWGATGEATTWYPRFRLFRQTAPGDWAGVFARVAQALRERLGR